MPRDLCTTTHFYNFLQEKVVLRYLAQYLAEAISKYLSQ